MFDVKTSLTVSARTWFTVSECIELQFSNWNRSVVDVVVDDADGCFPDRSSNPVLLFLVSEDSLDAGLSLDAILGKDNRGKFGWPLASRGFIATGRGLHFQ